jgi:hypothetical protein
VKWNDLLNKAVLSDEEKEESDVGAGASNEQVPKASPNSLQGSEAFGRCMVGLKVSEVEVEVHTESGRGRRRRCVCVDFETVDDEVARGPGRGRFLQMLATDRNDRKVRSDELVFTSRNEREGWQRSR